MTGTASGGELTVLYADDDPDVAELVRLAIGRQPDFCLVAATDNAAEISDLLRKHRPDVVILDHVLDPRSLEVIDDFRRRGAIPPTQTGLELVEVARTTVPEATIVIFTGVQGLGQAARNAGADVCIEKPHLDAVWPAIRAARAGRAS